jgi:hypothetical protein
MALSGGLGQRAGATHLRTLPPFKKLHVLIPWAEKKLPDMRK